MEILEKVAYLKGLSDGMDLKSEKSKESKLLVKMLDLLEDMALEIQDMQDAQVELEEGLDAVSDDLSDVESFLYEMDEEDEDGCCCGDDGDCCCDGEDDCCCCEDDEEGICYETVCPNCNEAITFDEDTLDIGYILCPSCGKKLEFALDDDDESCLCGCHDYIGVDDDDEEDEDD